jgi:thioredoxin 1
MQSRRLFLQTLVASTSAAILRPTASAAFGGLSFDATLFGQIQATGRPILLETHAKWCPVCNVQSPLVTLLLGKQDFTRFVRFSLDYKTDKDVQRQFGVYAQSTLIVFRGRVETGRTIGDTSLGGIEELLRTAI